MASTAPRIECAALTSRARASQVQTFMAALPEGWGGYATRHTGIHNLVFGIPAVNTKMTAMSANTTYPQRISYAESGIMCLRSPVDVPLETP